MNSFLLCDPKLGEKETTRKGMIKIMPLHKLFYTSITLIKLRFGLQYYDCTIFGSIIVLPDLLLASYEKIL